MQKIESENLLLREWLDQDLDTCSRITRDLGCFKVMLDALSQDETAIWRKRMQLLFPQHGVGFSALVHPRYDTQDCPLLHSTLNRIPAKDHNA